MTQSITRDTGAAHMSTRLMKTCTLLPHPWLWIGILTIVALDSLAGRLMAHQGPAALDPLGVDHVPQGAVGAIQEPLLILLAGVLILVGLRAYKLSRK